MGPRAVPFQANGAAAEAPVRLADNPDSWLAFTDLVFVDPVGAGYSRAAGDGVDAEKAFWGVEKDTDSMAEAVRLWLSRNGRELAPSISLAKAMAASGSRNFPSACSAWGSACKARS